MNHSSLTIFANFRIDNKERFEIMKISFNSFSNVSASKWVINVRGKFKNEVVEFLRRELGEKLSANQLESKKGWFSDSAKMLPQIETEYILFWVEDHINLVSVSKYETILKDMKEFDVDYLLYSWWHKEIKEIYSHIDKIDTNNISIYKMNKENANIVKKKRGSSFYMISMQSITTSKFFKNIILKPPKFRSWPKETPFDFEKSSSVNSFYPFKSALPKFELFANLDDDNGVHGYSLKSRGYYKDIESNDSLRELRLSQSKERKFLLKKIVPNLIYVYMSKFKQTINRIIYSLN
jgi:hypothetical protein